MTVVLLLHSKINCMTIHPVHVPVNNFRAHPPVVIAAITFSGLF